MKNLATKLKYTLYQSKGQKYNFFLR